MKHIHSLVSGRSVYTLFFALLCLAAGCKKDDSTSSNNNNNNNNNGNNNGNPLTHNDSLLVYKNSVHLLFVGFLVGDGNDPAAGYNPAMAPDSADYLEFFAGRDTSAADWRVAQAKGTKIVVCHFISDAYFDGSVKDPATHVPGYVNPTGFSQTTPTSTSTYNHWASNTYKREIDTQKLDGIDIDIEIGTFGGDVHHNAANGDSVMVALARYYGPNASTHTAGGKKPAFFYDTDGSSGLESNMYTPYKSNYTLALFQSYTTGNHAWSGTGTASFAPLVTTYGADKLVFLVNGDSFKYPNGTEDQAGSDAKATSDLYSYATWVKANGAAGVGAYRMSRDYNHIPPFAVSRHAIQIMNPAH